LIIGVEISPAVLLPDETYALTIRTHLHPATFLWNGAVTMAVAAMVGITGNQVRTLPVAYRTGTAWGRTGRIRYCALPSAIGTTPIHYHIVTPMATFIARILSNIFPVNLFNSKV
jgi:hypothetical protein